jgi:hypothetical protein
MPVRKVKGGYRWGNSGKIYRGKGAKRKAARQGAAIRAAGYANSGRSGRGSRKR